MVNKSSQEKSLKRRKGMDLPQRRFGLIAIEKGFIKADQLYIALMRPINRKVNTKDFFILKFSLRIRE